MRPDMSKVIVERPRRGSRTAKHVKPGRTTVVEDDDGQPLPARTPRSSRTIKTKTLNENLAPLKRYLASQVNRPWDKVYADIAENLKVSSTVQQHVRDHVEDFVALHVRLVDDQLLVAGRFGGEVPLARDWRLFYVHPVTGLLRRNPKPASMASARKARLEAEAADRPTRMRVVGPLEQLHLLADDNWWHVRLAEIERGKVSAPNAAGVMKTKVFEKPYEDVVLRAKMSELSAYDLYGQSGLYAIAKRPLTKAEKKRLGLI